MNETEEVVRPNETEEDLTLDQMAFDEEEAEETASADAQPTETEEGTAEPTEEEVDLSPLLETLSKELKYMDEEVTIEDINKAKELLQKGLDYDRKNSKLEELKNDEGLKWLDTKAKENGMTRQEYLKAVQEFETQQAKAQEEAELNDMLDNGIAEEVARKVIETNRIAKELAAEKARLKEQEAQLKVKEAKEREDQRFLEAYPDVDIKSIPKEVFKDAEQTSLLEAYTRYKNQELMKELEILKQNEKNKKTSPVKATTDNGSGEIEKDPFLKGFM